MIWADILPVSYVPHNVRSPHLPGEDRDAVSTYGEECHLSIDVDLDRVPANFDTTTWDFGKRTSAGFREFMEAEHVA